MAGYFVYVDLEIIQLNFIGVFMLFHVDKLEGRVHCIVLCFEKNKYKEYHLLLYVLKPIFWAACEGISVLSHWLRHTCVDHKLAVIILFVLLPKFMDSHFKSTSSLHREYDCIP